MYKITFIFLLIVPLSLFAKDDVLDDFIDSFPKDLTQIKNSETTKNIRDKFINKIHSENDQSIQLAYFSKDNDVTLKFKKNKLEYILIEIPQSLQEKSRFIFEKIANQLSTFEKKEINNIAKNASDIDSQYINIPFKKKGISLVFYNNSNRDIKSIIFFKNHDKN